MTKMCAHPMIRSQKRNTKILRPTISFKGTPPVPEEIPPGPIADTSHKVGEPVSKMWVTRNSPDTDVAEGEGNVCSEGTGDMPDEGQCSHKQIQRTCDQCRAQGEPA